MRIERHRDGVSCLKASTVNVSYLLLYVYSFPATSLALTCCNTYLIPNALNFALVWFFEYITALG